jgi:DNA polymerase-3 subunit beta
MIVMKTTQEKLLSVLQSVSGIVERRHTLPILANVLIRKTDGCSSPPATWKSRSAHRPNSAATMGNFTTTIGARKLIDILRTMPADQNVVLESSQNKMILKGGKSKFTLQTMPAEDFPAGAGGARFRPDVQRAAKDPEGPARAGGVCDGGA